jgi:hypothetical protein
MNGDELKIDINELKKRKLFVATPLFGGQCSGQYTKSFMALSNLFKEHGIELQWEALSNESLITRARNLMVDAFLRSGCTHLLFIDADIEFNPVDVLTLLSLCDEQTDKDVVCGPYPRKNISWAKVALAVEEGFHLQNPNLLEHFAGELVFTPLTAGPIDLQKPFEVLESGTGFMMIKRSVFIRFAKAHPELAYQPDHKRTKEQITAFFMDLLEHQGEYYKGYAELKEHILSLGDDEKIELKTLKKIIDKTEETLGKMGRRHLSEDYYFCQEVRKLGMKVWLCPWMMVNHVGTYKFVGDMFALAELARHSI